MAGVIMIMMVYLIPVIFIPNPRKIAAGVFATKFIENHSADLHVTAFQTMVDRVSRFVYSDILPNCIVQTEHNI